MWKKREKNPNSLIELNLLHNISEITKKLLQANKHRETSYQEKNIAKIFFQFFQFGTHVNQWILQFPGQLKKQHFTGLF